MLFNNQATLKTVMPIYVFSINEHEPWVEDWKKYCNNKHHTGSILNIFFQSSSLGQKDYEISHLIGTK